MTDLTNLKYLRRVVTDDELKKFEKLTQLNRESPQLYGEAAWSRALTPQLGSVELPQEALIEEIGKVLTLRVVATKYVPGAPSIDVVTFGKPMITSAEIFGEVGYRVEYEFTSFSLQYYDEHGYEIHVEATLPNHGTVDESVDTDVRANSYKVPRITWPAQ